MDDQYKNSFGKGVESAKITSKKQGVIRGILFALVIAVSFFNSLPIILKIGLFIVLVFILGIISSSNKFKDKL